MKTQICGELKFTVNPKTSMRIESGEMQRAAKSIYKSGRQNGIALDCPMWQEKGDGACSYERLDIDHKIIKYTEGPRDRAWMEECDRNYIFRLENEGRLSTVEPKLEIEVPALFKEIQAYRKAKLETSSLVLIEKLLDNITTNAIITLDLQVVLSNYIKVVFVEARKQIGPMKEDRFVIPDFMPLTADELNQIFRALAQNQSVKTINFGNIDLNPYADAVMELMDKRADIFILPSVQAIPAVNVIFQQRAEQARLEKEQRAQLEAEEKARQEPPRSIPIPPSAEAYSVSYTIPYEALTFGAELGSGSYGDVCRGTWQHSDVAIKKLKISRLAPATLESFKTEAEIMWGLRHDNIVQLYGVSVDNPGHYCLVMELMPQCSLFDVIHNGQPFEWKVRYSIASDIAKGLSLLHDRGVIHQDLKSPNVLIGDGMRAKITDFGLAQVKTETSTLASTMPREQTSTGQAKPAGTLRWMAPELFRRRAKATTQSDIHSYGMILWELVSRAIPFADAASDATVERWISDGEQEAIPEDCSPPFAALITKCWKERTERPTADQAITDLAEIQQQEETQGPQYQIFSI
jgi:hypothetical protein